VAKPQTFGTEIKMAGDATSGHKGGNPWHDPKSGRFTSGPAAGAAEPGNPPGNNENEIVVTAPRFRTQGDRPSAGAHHLPPEQILAAIKQTGLLSLRIAELHAEHTASTNPTQISKLNTSFMNWPIASSVNLRWLSGLDPMRPASRRAILIMS